MDAKISFLLLVSLIFSAGCLGGNEPVSGGVDSHGCRISEGFGWCETRQECLIMPPDICPPVPDEEINSFAGCVEAGYPVMESLPRQCRTSDGTTFTEVEGQELVGGHRDEHGCLTPAGYSWSSDVGACIREWELDESQMLAAEKAVEYVGYVEGMTVVGVDTARCPGCFVVHLERGKGRIDVTLGNWEVIDRSLTPDECLDENGRLVSAAAESDCRAGEEALGKVTGLVTPQICCVPKTGSSGMGIEEALDIAGHSECVNEGMLTDEYFYNDNTRTWWINLDVESPGCNPACVVSEDTLTAEINWRCTGLITEKHACTSEEKQANICTLEYAPVCGDNGKTYGNGCSACASNEIDSWTEGECPEKGPMLGTGI